MKRFALRQERLNIAIIAQCMILCACKEAPKDDRAGRLGEISKNVAAFLTVGAVAFVLIMFFAYPIAENARRFVVKRLKVTPHTQAFLAKAIYGLTSMAVLAGTFVIPELKKVRQAVLILLVATAYPFFCELLPGIRNEDANLRKCAVNHIKTAFFLIFVFWVVMKILSVDGLGPIKIM